MRSVRRSTAGLLAAALALALPVALPAWREPVAARAGAPTDAATDPLGLAELRQQAATDGSVPLLVAVADGADDPAAAIAAALDGTTSSVAPVADGLVSVEADPEGLERLTTAAAVTGVGKDEVLRLAVTAAAGPSGAVDPAADAGPAHAIGIIGAGRNIAVIDTGVDLAHPAFAGAVVAEACFVAGVGGTCPNGQTTHTGAGSGTPCTVAADACGHGTHVAGIALGRPSPGQPAGAAPGAGLISIRIFDADPEDAGAVAARSQDLIRAFDEVIALRQTMPIDAINLSVSGDPLYSGSCDDLATAEVSRRVDELRALGVATVSATGNGGSPTQISFPSCLSNVVRVTATDGTDAIASFANRNAQVRLAAPGVDITSAAVGGGTGVRSGTSMAAPRVSGALALMGQRYAATDLTWLLTRLETTGRRITDPATGLDLHRVEVAAALGVGPDPAGVGVRAAGAWVVTDRGDVRPVGQARDHGGSPALAAGERVVAASSTRSGLGYWLVTDRGRVLPYGDATHHGDARDLRLNQPITAMAPTAGGGGYWLLGGDGGVFSYGDARFHGSTGGWPLNAPVTDLAATPTGGGYWLTARDGGVFSFGDARFAGSTGGWRLQAPVVSIAAGPAAGYWLVATDGGVFAFDVPFLGSIPATGTPGTGLRVRASAAGRGYHILTADGRARGFGLADSFGPVPLAVGERVVDLVVLS